jgi:hypothetical protein
MQLGNIAILPDPRELWSKVLRHDDDSYNMLSLIKELKSEYGITWVGFENFGNILNQSKYKVIDEKKFGYFIIRHSDLIENF